MVLLMAMNAAPIITLVMAAVGSSAAVRQPLALV